MPKTSSRKQAIFIAWVCQYLTKGWSILVNTIVADKELTRRTVNTKYLVNLCLMHMKKVDFIIAVF